MTQDCLVRLVERLFVVVSDFPVLLVFLDNVEVGRELVVVCLARVTPGVHHKCNGQEFVDVFVEVLAELGHVME